MHYSGCLAIMCCGENSVPTDAMIMRRPAPLEPPIMETTKLGTMAMLRVIRFRTHFFILMSRNPCMMYCPA